MEKGFFFTAEEREWLHTAAEQRFCDSKRSGVSPDKLQDMQVIINKLKPEEVTVLREDIDWIVTLIEGKRHLASSERRRMRRLMEATA